MAKIWKNRIMAGARKLADCPLKYRMDVIVIQEDMDIERLKMLVQQDMMTPAEYEEITGEEYDGNIEPEA